MSEPFLSTEEHRQLLTLARESIAAHLSSESPPDFQGDSTKLLENGAAFVTIKIDGQLRGCIGYTEAFKPLYRTVQDCAKAAAFDDPRFPPLSADEFKKIAIDISVLTPLQLVASPEEVIVGRHGLVIAAQGRRGLLLPQVATDNGWDRDTFLNHTCLKAGLPPQEWKLPDTQIYLFEAEVFAEEDFR